MITQLSVFLVCFCFLTDKVKCEIHVVIAKNQKSSRWMTTDVDHRELNPILDGGGHYGPDDRERPRCFRRVRATTTKIHDFVSVYV